MNKARRDQQFSYMVANVRPEPSDYGRLALAKKSTKHIENLQRAIIEWGLSVDPRRVVHELGGYREYHACGTHYCVGGYVATWPWMRRQGVRADPAGGPCLQGVWVPSDVAAKLFGDRDLFGGRGDHPADGLPGAQGLTDYEIGMLRFNWALADPYVRL